MKNFEEEINIKRSFTRLLSTIVIGGAMIVNLSGVQVAQAAEKTTYDYTCIAETSIAGKIDIGMKVSPNVTVPETVESEGKLTLENISSDIEIDLEGNLN